MSYKAFSINNFKNKKKQNLPQRQANDTRCQHTKCIYQRSSFFIYCQKSTRGRQIITNRTNANGLQCTFNALGRSNMPLCVPVGLVMTN